MIRYVQAPVCHRCVEPRAEVVTFAARNRRDDGSISAARGSTRFIRLCRACVAALLREFQVRGKKR